MVVGSVKGERKESREREGERGWGERGFREKGRPAPGPSTYLRGLPLIVIVPGGSGAACTTTPHWLVCARCDQQENSALSLMASECRQSFSTPNPQYGTRTWGEAVDINDKNIQSGPYLR